MADGFVSKVNSSINETLLGAGGVFTGLAEDVDQYSLIVVTVHSDVASATDGLEMQFSMDGNNWDRVKDITTVANASQTAFGGAFTVIPIVQFFRVVYTNGGTIQTEFRLSAKYHKYQSKGLTSQLDQTINDQSDVDLVRAAVMGQDSAGNFRNVPVDGEGHLRIHISDPLSAFGDLRVSDLTPQVQIYFAYNINTDVVNTSLVASGTVTQANAMAVVSSGAATSSSARLETKHPVKYRAGQGSLVRYTALFTAGVTGNTQIAGAFDADNGVAFGYSGTSFGILVRNGASDSFTAQTSWNVDIMDGNDGDSNPSNMLIDPTKGNVFQIRYQWLGFGEITFFIENPVTGEYVIVHRVKYANTNTVPSMTNPSFPLAVESINTSNNTDIIVKTSSMAGFTEGKDVVTGPFNSIDNELAVTTEANVLTIQNKSTYQSINNKVSLKMVSLSIATDGTKNVIVKLIKNTTLGGTPSYTDISTNTSAVSYDVAGTTITTGQVIETYSLAKDDSQNINLKELELELFPGEILTVSAASAGSNTVDVALSWREDF